MSFKKLPILLLLTFAIQGCGSSSSNALPSSSNSEVRVIDLNNLSMKVETSMLLEDDYSLHLKGSWDNFENAIALTRDGDFLYSCSLPSLKNETYTFYTLINNDENYREAFVGSYSFSYSGEEAYHKINGFVSLPTKEKTWSILNGDTAIVDEHNDGSITVENNAWQSGFVAKDVTSDITKDTYKMSAHFKGKKNANEIGEAYIGFLAYYKDSQNYLFCYTMWHPDCVGVVRVIGITGFINGIDVSWHDCMSAPTSLAIGPSDGFTLELNRNKSAFEVKLTADNGSFIEGATSVPQVGSSLTNYLGFFVQGDSIDISNINFEEYTKEEVPSETFKTIGSVASLSVVDENNLTVKNLAWNSGFVVRKDSKLCSNYVVSSDIKGTATTNLNNVYIGLVPYFINESNYVFVYLQWYNGKIKSIGMTGFSNGIDLGWMDFWDFTNLSILPTDNIHFEVEVNVTNHTVKATLGNVSQMQTVSSVNQIPEYIGVYCCNVTVSFSNFTCEEAI